VSGQFGANGTNQTKDVMWGPKPTIKKFLVLLGSERTFENFYSKFCQLIHSTAPKLSFLAHGSDHPRAAEFFKSQLASQWHCVQGQQS